MGLRFDTSRNPGTIETLAKVLPLFRRIPFPRDRFRFALTFPLIQAVSGIIPTAYYLWPAFTVSPFPIISKPVHHSCFQASLGEISHKI